MMTNKKAIIKFVILLMIIAGAFLHSDIHPCHNILRKKRFWDFLHNLESTGGDLLVLFLSMA